MGLGLQNAQQLKMMISQLVADDVFEKSPAFMAILLGDQFIFSEANARYREIVGGRDIIGKPVDVALPEIKEQGFLELLKKVYHTGETYEGKEMPVNLISRANPNPQQTYMNFIYRRITSADGAPVGIFVFGTDVTELVMSRKKIEETELQFRQFIDGMPQIAFIASPDGSITYFNKPWYDYVNGLENTEGWGWKDQPVHHPDDLQYTIDRWTHSLKTGEPYEIEYRLRRHDGVYRWYLGRATPVRDANGQIMRWVGTNTDIHDNKETEVKLAEALRSRDEFLSIASHELKTPLTAMHLQNQIFKRAAQKTDSFERQKVEDMVEQNERQVVRLKRLVDDMLDVSRIQSGQLRTYKVLSDLSSHLHDIVEKMTPQFLQKGFAAPELQIEPEIDVDYDMLRLEQVVSNLLSNAVRYGDKKPVIVSLHKEKDSAVIKVKDHGFGISEEDQKRIFEKFERAIDSYDVSGLGLGLYISKKIIDAHEGQISVKSLPGQGAEFIVTLPLPVQAQADDDLSLLTHSQH